MINSVGAGSGVEFRQQEQGSQPDPLVEKRVEDARKHVISAMQDQHKQKVAATIEAHADFESRKVNGSSASMLHVQRAYNEF